MELVDARFGLLGLLRQLLASYIGQLRLLLTPLSKVFVLKDSVGQQLIALR